MPFSQQMGFCAGVVTAGQSSNCFRPPPPVCPLPLPMHVAKLPASASFLTCPQHCWPGCSPCSGVTQQPLSSLRHCFHITDLPNAESPPWADSHVTFPHLISLLFHLFSLCHSLSMPKVLEFNFPPDFILREWY